MGAAKKKIQVSEVEVGNRTLEAVLLDLAERSARAEERFGQFEERSARCEERSARAEERSARAEEGTMIALQTLAALSKDLRAIAQNLYDANARAEARFGPLEKAAGLHS